jgi:hypothetical protein
MKRTEQKQEQEQEETKAKREEGEKTGKEELPRHPTNATLHSDRNAPSGGAAHL